MAVEANPPRVAGALDKRLLRQTVAALQARLGLNHDRSATGEQAQAITLSEGINPDDRILSSEILRMRQEEKE
jgi:hypothetical protein